MKNSLELWSKLNPWGRIYVACVLGHYQKDKFTPGNWPSQQEAMLTAEEEVLNALRWWVSFCKTAQTAAEVILEDLRRERASGEKHPEDLAKTG